MQRSLDKARDELKRIDHLIYVSLKYTRTSDVLKSVVERFINLYDWLISSMLKHAQEQKIIEDYPKSPGLQCELIKKIRGDDERICGMIDQYLIFRKMLRSDYVVDQEFKRHVNLRFDFENEIIDINIDEVTDHYKKAKEDFAYIESLLSSE